MVFLGYVDSNNLYDPVNKSFAREYTPRGVLKSEAAQVPPPPRGQNVRAPIDGVNAKRYQEWTMEYLTRLVEKGLINSQAVDIAQAHRNVLTHGIFGQGGSGQRRKA
ncbi:hypothetical protein TOPH_08604 [Tolypocladium ophioglossoides CBS 100239]|uniref:Uncharacterized protein n=1 Tax=Tolypocladium ophioglossoides (strain CBS 100239) TaxID=1163406 RepID=A0A0L0MY09_TOLOC|nr:hypothetical protein TOPH_08604 [Tolypocladium ophioglossoides CBS 100239]